MFETFHIWKLKIYCNTGNKVNCQQGCIDLKFEQETFAFSLNKFENTVTKVFYTWAVVLTCAFISSWRLMVAMQFEV